MHREVVPEKSLLKNPREKPMLKTLQKVATDIPNGWQRNATRTIHILSTRTGPSAYSTLQTPPSCHDS